MGDGGNAARILSEVLGTCLLFVTLSLSAGSAAGAAGAALLIALKKTLKGTFNPAVTIADMIIKDLEIKDGLLITAAQCGGAALGAVLSTHVLHGGQVPVPGDGNSELAMEALFTCMVCLGISASLDGNDIAYGAAFFAACSAAGGAAFNPAIVVGVCFQGKLPWAVILAEIAGAILAGCLRHVIKNSSGPAEKGVAEFIAAFFLTATALKATGPLPAAAALAFAICALGASGNSVIAVANFFSKKENLGDSTVAILGQFAGAACGALLLKAIGSGGSLSLGTSGPPELIFSAVLGMVAVSGDLDIHKGIALGLALFTGMCATSGILNPAIALGAAVQSTQFGPFLTCTAWEIGGGCLGALVMHAIYGTGFGVKAREVAVEEKEEYRSMIL